MKPFVVRDRGGTPRLANSRINVYDVVHYLERGRDANYIALVLGIRLVEAEALVRYVEEHKEEVMAVHRQIEERIAKGNPPEIEAKLQESRGKLQALRAKLQQEQNRETNDGSSLPR